MIGYATDTRRLNRVQIAHTLGVNPRPELDPYKPQIQAPWLEAPPFSARQLFQRRVENVHYLVEPHDRFPRSVSLVTGSVVGTALGLAISYYLQEHGVDFGRFLKDSTLMMSGVYRSRITPFSWVVGFIPGLFATVLGTMLAGVGILTRNTAQLFKELES